MTEEAGALPGGIDVRDGQCWDADRYARNARFVSDLGMPVVELLAPRPDERILDLGCGDGDLTAKLAALGCRVVGVDASPELVRAARERGIDARLADAARLDFRAEFDAVFSNAALHWMKDDPDGVVGAVWRALRPGGRFVAEMGGAGNCATIRAALYAALERRGVDPLRHDPWYFPAPEEYHRKLAARGFVVRSMEFFPRPTPLPGDLLDWLDTFAGCFAVAVPAADGEALYREVRDAVRAHACDAGGRWIADYVRLRFRAEKPHLPGESCSGS